MRILPILVRLWQRSLALPLLEGLHRLTAVFPIPLLELMLPAALASGLLRKRLLPLLAGALGVYLLLWYPAYFAAPAPSPASARDAEPLCLCLVDALNASPLAFESPLPSAGDAAGMPWARVKAAGRPGWMRALGIAGLFSPWTGEALVDADAPPGYLPFTCVHELMHLRGIADEGAANIAAWQACLSYGGMYADSARLWALRYAMARLSPAARDRVTRRMGNGLRGIALLSEPVAPGPAARMLGIARQVSDYDALVDWLVDNGAGGWYDEDTQAQRRSRS